MLCAPIAHDCHGLLPNDLELSNLTASSMLQTWTWVHYVTFAGRLSFLSHKLEETGSEVAEYQQRGHGSNVSTTQLRSSCPPDPPPSSQNPLPSQALSLVT